MQKSTFLVTILVFFSGFFAFAQTSQVRFGKNRVQYHRDFDEWSQYESDNFITYWYGEGRNVGQAVVQLAEYDFNYIQNILEHRVNEKIQIIVYTDLTDLKQSNIGSEEAFVNTGGQTKIVGNKIFVYFNGDHNHLRRQIREGIASVYLEAMLFGSNLQEIVQNAVMMNLPEWFKAGLISFVGESWDPNLDNQLRDILLGEDFRDFNRFSEENPTLAGHSLWYFIDQNYGSTMVSNLLYLTRINRSVESGFLYVLGNSYEMVVDQWYNFFYNRYQTDLRTNQPPTGTELPIKNKRKLPISQVKLSPNGQNVVYVTNEIGKYKVFMQEVATGNRKQIFGGGFRNAFQATDYNYPLISWNPSGLEIAIIYEQRDVVKLLLYDITTGKSKEEDFSSQYQRVYSLDYINPTTLVISGAVRGFSDLFLYYIATRQTQRITNDFHDDLDATFVKIGNQRGILFSSNRPDSMLMSQRLDTILPINTFDIFYYDLENKSQELVRVTNTPLANERQPVPIDTTYFAYLSDQNGIYNRSVGYLEEYIHHYEQTVYFNDGTDYVIPLDSSLASLDSTLIDTVIISPVIKKRSITYPTTNLDRNILEQNTAPRVNKQLDLIYRDGLYRLFIKPVNVEEQTNPLYTSFQQNRLAIWMEQLRKQGLDNSAISLLSPSQIQTQTPIFPVEPPEVVPVEPPPIEEEIVEEDIPETVAAPDSIPEERPLILFQSEFDDRDMIRKPRAEGEATIQLASPITPEDQPEMPLPLLNNPIASGEKPDVYPFRPGRIVPYRLQFRTDYVTTQLDNSLLFEGLDSYAANPDGFEYPPPGILLKANFKDLFEDYEFEGGIRLPTTFNGLEYFAIYRDKKKRLDKSYAVYSRLQRFSQESATIVPQRSESNILLGQFGLGYPLDIFRSLRATTTLRRDRLTQLATDFSSFDTPTTNRQRIGIKLEYVFDNTLDVALNIKNGTRYKVYAEFMKSFDLSLTDGFSLDLREGAMGVIGLDARHYQRVLKHSVFAMRLAAATTFGSERILYYLGGVDNWLFPSL